MKKALTFGDFGAVLGGNMIEHLFLWLSVFDDFYWRYVGFFLVVVGGVYFSFRSGFYQLRVLRHLPDTVRALAGYSGKEMPGVSPLRLYFASIGGMVGLGNIVAVITALVVGGPGALFWLWVAAFAGMLIKYAEIYLGMKYRRANTSNGYDGGPMYTIPAAFRGRVGVILANIAAVLLCIYGVEVFQFTVIVDTIQDNVAINREVIIGVFLVFTIYVGLGGVKRLANVCTWLMPLFIVMYVILCGWVIVLNIGMVPEMVVTIFKSAFTGHAAVGGFAGSTLLMAAQQGAARAMYSGDVAIGFDSIIQSETKTHNFYYQARMAIVASFTDAVICSMSMIVVYLTGLWTMEGGGLKTSEYVARALALHIPHSQYFVVLIIFLAGFTTILAYFAVGLKAAKFLSWRFGKGVYYLYAVVAFWFFAHFDQTSVLLIMSLSGGMLILINLVSIMRLRKEVCFKFAKKEEQ